MRQARLWFDTPGVRWRVVITVVVLATIVFAIWLGQRRGLWEPVSPRVGSPTAGALARQAVSQAVLPVAPDTDPAASASAVEVVCGSGITVGPGTGGEARDAAVESAMKRLNDHGERIAPAWIAGMKTHPDDAVKAAGWVLELRQDWEQRYKAREAKLASCGDDERCANRLGRALWEEQRNRSVAGIDELVRLAARSRDPTTYAIAMHACTTMGHWVVNPACDALSYSEWAAREPGNGLPWLEAAAAVEDDSDKRAQLVERAFEAVDLRSHWGMMVPLTLKAAPPGSTDADRSFMMFQAIGADALLAPETTMLLRHCKSEELQRPARRLQCERLTSLLAEKSDLLITAMLPRAMGRELGWSADRLAALDTEREALAAVIPGDSELGACERQRGLESYLAEVARIGEIPALRARLRDRR